MEHQTPAAYVHAVKCEHRAIHEKARHVEAVLRDAIAQNWHLTLVQSLADHLVDLEHCLQEHFHREEQGGFLDDAAAHAPRLAGESEHLMHEHTEILARVREMIEHARSSQNASPHLRYAFAQSLQAVLRQLFLHETRENVLLATAFNLDSETLP